jgi:hypothetical protein
MTAEDIVDLTWMTGPSQAQPLHLVEVMTVAGIVELQRRHGALHVRFSAGPDDDARTGGRHPESGYTLPGLPAWPLQAEPWWPAGQAVWIARQLVQNSYQLTAGTRAWLLVGDVVGRGPDCEPLLAHVQPVASVAGYAIQEAQGIYAAWRCRDVR